MTTGFARAIEGIPVVASAAERDANFATPTQDQRVFNKATGNLERWVGSMWLSDFTPPRTPFGALTSRGGAVTVAPYQAVTGGTANFGPTGGQTSLEFVGIGHTMRIRQNGTVSLLRTYLASIVGITGLYLKVWRDNGSTYDLVGVSGNLAVGLAAGVINSLAIAPGLVVQEGDYVGLRVEYSSASVQNFFAATIPNSTLGENGGTTYSVLNATPSAVAYDWAAQTATVSQIVLIEVQMAAPVFAMIGDSITSGRVTHASFADTYAISTSITDAYPYRLSRALGYTYQNMGRAGEGVAQLAARFAADIVAKNPRVVLIMGGVNDLLNGTSNATILVSVTAMLDAAKAAGITPVVIGVAPFRAYALATTPMLQQRDLLNASLRTLVTSSTYNGVYVNPDAYLGQYYASGDAGNLWKLATRYDSGDGIHPNSAGYVALAQAVVDVIGAIVVQVASGLPGVTQLGSFVGVGTTAPIAILTVGQATANPNGNIYALGYGFAKTDTSQRRVGALAQSSDSVNPFLLYAQVLGAAVLANRIASLQTADDASANGGNIALQPLGGNVGIGTSSNVPANRLVVIGGVGIGDITYNVAAPADGAIIKGIVGIGTVAPAGTKLHVVRGSSTTDQGSASIKAYNTLTRGVWMGYDTTNGFGMIGAVTEGASHDPLLLNPLGGGVAIGSAVAPDTKAILDLVSTTKGLLLPRMTTTQRDAITSPPAGLTIYNTTTNKMNVRAAAAWEAVTSA